MPLLRIARLCAPLPFALNHLTRVAFPRPGHYLPAIWTSPDLIASCQMMRYLKISTRRAVKGSAWSVYLKRSSPISETTLQPPVYVTTHHRSDQQFATGDIACWYRAKTDAEESLPHNTCPDMNPPEAETEIIPTYCDMEKQPGHCRHGCKTVLVQKAIHHADATDIAN